MTIAIRGVNGPVLGKFRLAAVTGLTTGLGAGAIIFAARFAPTAAIRALITDFRIKGSITVPFTAANDVTANAYLCRSFTASDTGGTAQNPTGIQNMISSIDGAPVTAFTDIRVASATALAAGTRTVDPFPFMSMPGAQPGTSITAGLSFETDMPMLTDQRWAINLQGQTNGVAANAEGIEVQLPVAQGAGGVVRYAIEMEWLEYFAGFSQAPGL